MIKGAKVKVSWYACSMYCALGYMNEWPHDTLDIEWEVGIRGSNNANVIHSQACKEWKEKERKQRFQI